MYDQLDQAHKNHLQLFWQTGLLCWPMALSRLAPLQLADLLAAAAARRKTYAGRVHIATQESAAPARQSNPFPARTPPKSVVTPGCRKSRNARSKGCAQACGAPEIALRRFRTAREVSPRNPSDGPQRTGVLSAACLKHDRSGRWAGLFRSAFSPGKHRQKSSARQEQVSASSRYNTRRSAHARIHHRTCPRWYQHQVAGT